MPNYFKICCTFFVIATFLIMACNQNKSQENINSKPDTITPTPTIVKVENPSFTEKYTASNTQFTEQLSITRLSKDSIQFSWLISGNTTAETMQGIAVKSKTADFEMDEDETGLSYPAEEYIYKKGSCYLYLRLSVDLPNKRAVVKAANCNLTSYKTAQHKSSLAIVE